MVALPVGYRIRFGVPLDIAALIRADRAASELFRSTGLIPGMASIPESIPAPVLADAIGQTMLPVVTDETGAIGFALTRVYRKTLYLDQISVDPVHGQRGLGRALMYHVFALAEEHRLTSVTLSTFRDIPWNGPFYRQLGFQELPRRKMTHWMLDIEAAQAETLDITQRCFMQRSVRRTLLRRGLRRNAMMTNIAQDGKPSI